MPPSTAKLISESSADHFGRCSVKMLLAVFAVAMIVSTGAANPVRGIGTPSERPIVPLTSDGGVLMVPLHAERPGDSWPSTLPITLHDGRRITGRLAWIAPEPSRRARAWTDSPLGVVVRDIQPRDRTSAAAPGDERFAGSVRNAAGTPFLLVELPADATGPIRLLNQTLEPRWLAVPDAEHLSTEMLVRERAFDRPDPDHALEHWRWVMLADRLGKQSPQFHGQDGGESARLAAIYTTHLWQAAMHRVRRHSRGVAEHLRDVLTRICIDTETDVQFAAWPADPTSINALLNVLLDERLHGDALVNAALQWSDRQERLMIWLESASRDNVHVAIVNPSFRPVVARIRWDDPEDIPIAVELPAGRLTRVRIERRASEADWSRRTLIDDVERELEVLRIETVDAAGRDEPIRYALFLDEPALPVVPPGVYMPPLSPPLTLDSLQLGLPPILPDRLSTTAQLRRLQGRWELFIESHQPEQSSPAATSTEYYRGGVFDKLPDALRGRNAVIVLFGESERTLDAHTILAIPERGEPIIVRGERSEALRVHQRSDNGRWRCRIVLPDRWLSAHVGEATHLGVLRTIAGSEQAVATSPMPTVPWRIDPGRISIDLTHWDDVPRE